MKKVNTIVLIACIINCVVLDLLLLDKKFSLSNQTDVLELFVVAINFLFVIWVYFRDDKKAEKDKTDDKKRYWFHEVLIQHNLPDIQKLYTECIGVADELLKENDSNSMKVCIRKIKDQKKHIENTFGYMLLAYDKALYDLFSNKLILFEDRISKACVDLSMKDITREEYIQEVKKLEAELIEILMKHDLEKAA